jgi:hypothetical protein
VPYARKAFLGTLVSKSLCLIRALHTSNLPGHAGCSTVAHGWQSSAGSRVPSFSLQSVVCCFHLTAFLGIRIASQMSCCMEACAVDTAGSPTTQLSHDDELANQLALLLLPSRVGGYVCH